MLSIDFTRPFIAIDVIQLGHLGHYPPPANSQTQCFQNNTHSISLAHIIIHDHQHLPVRPDGTPLAM